MNAIARSFLLTSLLALGCAPTMVGGEDEGIIPNPDLESATLEIVGSESVGVSINSETSLRVLYLDQDGEPVNGAVNFTIQGSGNGASLSGTNIDTDAEGIATVNLRSRDIAQFRVRAAAAAADPVDFMINVTEGEIVSLRVTPEYAGTRAVGDIHTGVFTNYTCGEFAALVPTPQEMQTGRLGDTKEFLGIDTAAPVAVYSLGYNSRDFVAVFRCVDVDFTMGNEVQVDLTDVRNLQGGVFDMTETFDLTEGFPSSINFILDAATGLTTDPAGWLIDLAVDSGLPGWLTDILDDSRLLISGPINDAIDNFNRPGYVDDILEAGAQLDRVFTELTIAGTLSISEADEFGVGIAVHRLRELRVPIGEEVITRPLRDQRVDDVGIAFSDGSQIIDEHVFMVSLGEVMGIVLNDIILPRLPGAPNSIGELLGNLINCEGLANSEFLRNLIDNETVRMGVETVCEAGVAWAGNKINEEFMSLLDWDTLTLSGEGMTMDEDQDYRADEFEGVADATWSGGPAGDLVFEGTLVGTREGEELEREVDRVKAKFDAL